MNKHVENFLRYEIVRAHGYWNMITEAADAAGATGLSLHDYRDVQTHYEQYRDEANDYRKASEENEKTYTAAAMEMSARVKAYYQRILAIRKEVDDMMTKALSEEAPF